MVVGLAILLLLLPAKALYDNYQQAVGRRDAELAVLRPQVKALSARVQTLEQELKRAVPVAYKTKLVWDTLPPLIPDLLKPDAAPVPASQLAQVIIIGQEAVQSCHEALSPCLTLLPLKDSIIANQGKQISILQKRIPGRFDGMVQWGLRLGFFWLGKKVRFR